MVVRVGGTGDGQRLRQVLAAGRRALTGGEYEDRWVLLQHDDDNGRVAAHGASSGLDPVFEAPSVAE